MNPLDFAHLARMIAAEAKHLGLDVPTFRARSNYGPRTIRWHHGGATVTINHRRDPHLVATDIVDGIIAFTTGQLVVVTDNQRAELTLIADSILNGECYMARPSESESGVSRGATLKPARTKRRNHQ